MLVEKMLLASGLLLCASMTNAQETVKSITIPAVIEYQKTSDIQTNVLKECKTLNEEFAKELNERLTDAGWKISVANKLDTKAKGDVLDVKITDVTSSGSAFLFHHKAMSINAVLYRNGEQLATRKLSRSSGGGMFGQYKSSCTVLSRVTNALAADVTRWVKNPK